ncbi:MAG: c-type cytochrome [Gallionella sp.]
MKSKIIKTIAATAILALLFCRNVMATEMPGLAIQHKCNLCHSIDNKIVGPAWRDIAKHYRSVTTFAYKGKVYPLKEGLLLKVSNGGAGNWGDMPMYPIDPDDLSQSDLKKLIDFILKLPD